MKGSPGASESKRSTFSHRKTAGGSSGVPASPRPEAKKGRRRLQVAEGVCVQIHAHAHRSHTLL